MTDFNSATILAIIATFMSHKSHHRTRHVVHANTLCHIVADNLVSTYNTNKSGMV